LNDYHAGMLGQFEDHTKCDLKSILPAVRAAGEPAGRLTQEGVFLLDPTGHLPAGIPLCPPEGDAGTGMVATNSVTECTGNVSAGTSIFAMAVLEKALPHALKGIDMVTTPAGKPVAMVHCNNCTSDIDAWAKLFMELIEALGMKAQKPTLYDAMYFKALEGEPDCGGILSYNYYAGEPITGLEAGRPLLARLPDSRFSLANFMRSLIFSALGTLKIGMNILTDEHVRVDTLLGHGGFFKTKGVGQALMAAALNVPVAVMESAGEGGPWGMALLAAYMKQRDKGESLDAYLARRVFNTALASRVEPKAEDARGFADFMKRYEKGRAIERAAVENL
jgi:sugar (pentulose or hexulose) kinase